MTRSFDGQRSSTQTQPTTRLVEARTCDGTAKVRRFKGSTPTVAWKLLSSEELASATEATWKKVRTKCGTDDGTAVVDAAQVAVAEGRARLAVGEDQSR